MPKMKYNPFNSEWEMTATTGSCAATRRRILALAPPNSVMRFNPHKNSFEMAPKDWPLQYNSHTEEWVFAPPEAVAKMNPTPARKNSSEKPGSSSTTPSAAPGATPLKNNFTGLTGFLRIYRIKSFSGVVTSVLFCWTYLHSSHRKSVATCSLLFRICKASFRRFVLILLILLNPVNPVNS